MSEYTFETAALKAVTVDAVKYNEEGLRNSITPETIQAVAPIVWGTFDTPITIYSNSLVFGNGSIAGDQWQGGAIVIGHKGKVSGGSISIGNNNSMGRLALAIGDNIPNVGQRCVAIGHGVEATTSGSIVIGGSDWNYSTKTTGLSSLVIGHGANISYPAVINLGLRYTEATENGNVTHNTITEGTGSITIGAGANTLNNGDTESSNSVTIGCKALNQGADSVVLGAAGTSTGSGHVAIGAGAKTADVNSTAVGCKASAEHWSTALGINATAKGGGVSIGGSTSANGRGLAIGYQTNARAGYSSALGNGASTAEAASYSTAIGTSAKAAASYTTAIGTNANAADQGATVIRSTSQDGTYTQLYFSGANTPLAKKYFPTAWEQKQDVDPETGDPIFDDNGDPVMVDDPEKPIAGEALMGYVSKDSAGKIIARGANMLSALFPYYTGAEDDPFAPTTMSLDGEKPEPVAFHPSDLDLPQEEPTTPEMEEYTPLPVYPIVEPEIEEINE